MRQLYRHHRPVQVADELTADHESTFVDDIDDDKRVERVAELLLERATCGLPEALDVLTACHLTLCPECRARETELDAVGGATSRNPAFSA